MGIVWISTLNNLILELLAPVAIYELDRGKGVAINYLGDIVIAGEGYPTTGGSDMVQWIVD